MKRWLLIPLFLTACGATPNTIDGVKTYAYEGGDHQEGRIAYKEAHPVGGAHNAQWQNCGTYTQDLYPEYAVHSLEHGAVWVTYRPDLPQSEVLALQDALDGRTHTLLSPRREQTAPIVMTAWNAQLELERTSDPRVTAFIQKYEQAGTAPEAGASCSGAYRETQ
ncbi:DUF3105 domain-containing protein [Deinococcus sp. Leaf326]|jgi:hypothetical protein|uniref:DUF3105 domain-containing protein n=1 Tax=Deinococcus sp. Leaf326 TaxID=1736338 RepID=UPI0006F7E3A1|nr:DUF3105 domain-containing protein [Deinococcus sp. Leaf326]KQR35137.1 hypothetical protein ASF71_16275 [Deinococcus sp. Leaf326]